MTSTLTGSREQVAPITVPEPGHASERERTAARLLRSSAKTSYDPMVDVDWDAELVPGMLFTPEHRNSLYGTELWDGLSRDQRVELSKHEVASIASVGAWFEMILMQMLLRHAYDRRLTSEHVKYGLTEIADECRHSVMFATMIERFDCPAYGVDRLAHELARFFKTTSIGPLTFYGTMYVEEILDAFQREAMADESVQPIVRQVSRIHVVEEARHISYAREEGQRQWQRTTSRLGRAHTRLMLAAIGYFATTRLIHPQVYAAVGLDPEHASRVAAANPHWAEAKRFAAEKVLAIFADQGLIDAPSRRIWGAAGVLG